MSWINGPRIGQEARVPDPGEPPDIPAQQAHNPILDAALAYGQASYDQGGYAAVGDKEKAKEAHRESLVALSRLMAALPDSG